MLEGGVFSGPRARFRIDGQQVAYAGGVNGEEVVDYEPVDVLDLLEVAEHVPLGYRASMNCRLFRIVGLSAKQRNIFPMQDNILTSGVMEAVIEDNLTNRIVALVQGVRAASKSWDVGARGMVAEDIGFVCIRIKDEAEAPV